jgi:hypothetical protein
MLLKDQNNPDIRGELIKPGLPSPAATQANPNFIKGDLTVTGKISWKDGTAFLASLRHAISAARSYLFPDADGNVPVLPSAATTETGTGAIVRTDSPTLVTPTVASFTNAQHSHQNAAGGGALSAAAITSGTLADARLSANVPLKNAANVFTATQTAQGGILVDSLANLITSGGIDLSILPVNVTGSRGGNAALASLLTALASIGLITDSTS